MGNVGASDIIVIILALLFDFLPSIIAFSRNHRQSTAILILNLLICFYPASIMYVSYKDPNFYNLQKLNSVVELTFIGWCIALIWSLIKGVK